MWYAFRYSFSCLCTPRRLVSSNIRIVVVPNQRVRSRLIWPQYPPDMPPMAPRCEPTPTLVDSSWLAYVTKRQPLSNNRRLHTPVSRNIVPTPCYFPIFSETDTVRLFSPDIIQAQLSPRSPQSSTWLSFTHQFQASSSMTALAFLWYNMHSVAYCLSPSTDLR